MTLITTTQIGQEIEQQALDYLLKQGLHYKTRNFRCRVGEIDLILEDQKTLVFVEVRYRQNQEFGGALASITASKQKKLYKAAQYYLVKHHIYDKVATRFDVIAVQKTASQSFEFFWAKNALTF